VKLLGSGGSKALQAGSRWELPIDGNVHVSGDLFRLMFPQPAGPAPAPEVTIRPSDAAPRRLDWRCTVCSSLCEHVGAAFSLILEEKTALGLAQPPPERVPVESLTDRELIDRAMEERLERARAERMTFTPARPPQPWADYAVTSRESGRTYRVSIRGLEPGDSFCACPDFRTNTLGTCKHILHLGMKLKRRFTAAELKRTYKRKTVGVHIEYRDEAALRLLLPDKLDGETERIVGPLRGRAIDDVSDLVKRILQLERQGRAVNIYPDAEEFIQRRLLLDRISRRAAEVRKDPEAHPLRRELLKSELLPYQLDGIAFAASVGRAVLADEMGLGKTIQAIGAAEFLAREAGISKVLVVCPASVKSQWRSEIGRFCDRDCLLVSGALALRHSQYARPHFFTVCNYEQVLRDILAIERVKWDLIILDEGQRIKNWEAKTTRVIKGLRSRFALVLSGTPLENRLDELYSVVQFIDDRRLGPAFRFYNRHRIVDEKGKLLGYKNMTELREKLKPVMLRRTRESVRQQLPSRTNKILRVTPTEEQLDLHNTHMRLARQIAEKKFLTEMDLLRLQKHLLMCRMAADSTFLVDKQKPGYSSKIDALDDLFDRLFAEDDRNALLFSEWTTMLDLIEPLARKRRLPFVRLDGSVPQKQRQELVRRFQTDPNCRLFLTTNAGSTGLNLQAANTVINVDLPWNPAVLEQRIGRAYRMGQTRRLQVFILVTEDTIEEKLLGTLSAKRDLALAALDPESRVDEVSMTGGIEELRRRLEVLLGDSPAAPVDESGRRETQQEIDRRVEPVSRPERLAEAGGQLLNAAVNFLGELLPASSESDEHNAQMSALAATLKQNLSGALDRDDQGRARLSFVLPDPSALDNLTRVFARLLLANAAR
jgi:superfamily II DNA or RNA helicase